MVSFSRRLPPLHIAMLSMHSSPVGPLGRRDTGGMSVVVGRLAAALGIRGHRVDIFTAAMENPPAEPIGLAPNVRLVHLTGVLDEKKNGTGWGAAGEAGFAALETFRRADRGRYHLVHSHYWISAEVGRLVQKRWGTPHLVTFHTLGLAKTLADGTRREPADRLLSEARRVSDADRLLVPVPAEALLLERHYRAPAGKIDLVPWGVDVDIFRPLGKAASRRRLMLPTEDRILLYVGRFDPMKGLDTLCAAMGGLNGTPPIRLLVVGGDGENTPESRRLRALTRGGGAEDRVVFVGRQDQALLPWYYSAADALVMPSRYESFGLVGLEALACGTPLIASPVGVVPALMDGGRNGVLVDGGRPEDLVRAIRRFFDGAPVVGGAGARKTALAYRWEHSTDRLLDAYARALGRTVPEHSNPRTGG